VALGDLVLGALAVLFVILAVAFVEVDSKVIARTISLIGAVSQRLALTLVFFIAGLATFNAIPIALRPAVREPFRVGTPGLVALIATAITIAVQMVRSRQNAAK
jgi:hypothetical protein